MHVFAVISITVAFFLIIGFLAYLVEKKKKIAEAIDRSQVIYVLGFTVFFSGWSYYSVIGQSISESVMFFGVYVGVLITVPIWLILLKKIVRVSNRYNVTNVTDLLVVRYNKSFFIAVLTSLIFLVGSIPYLSLQFIVLIRSFFLLVGRETCSLCFLFNDTFSSIILLLIIASAVYFGVRTRDVSAEYCGLKLIVAFAGILKIVCLSAVGFFIIYGKDSLFSFGRVFEEISNYKSHEIGFFGEKGLSYLPVWLTYLGLGGLSFFFLPRQFQMTVVENRNEDHIKSAMMWFPFFVIIMTIFSFPLAVLILSKGMDLSESGVSLLLALSNNIHPLVALVLYIGGLFASVTMIMVTVTALAMMVSNNLALPLLGKIKRSRKYLFHSRWVVVVITIIASYMFAYYCEGRYSLSRLGLYSFTCASIVAIVGLFGLFWPKGNSKGACLGLSAGFLVWLYLSVVPLLVGAGFIDSSFLPAGPFGISWLSPETLFGVNISSDFTNIFIWTSFFTTFFYIGGSLYFEVDVEEKNEAEVIVDILKPHSYGYKKSTLPTVNLLKKIDMIKSILSEFTSESEADMMIYRSIKESGVKESEAVTLTEAAEFLNVVERYLSRVVGTATAHLVIKKCAFFSAAELRNLHSEYAGLLADLNISPEELKRKADYFKEREEIYRTHALELKKTVDNLRKFRRAIEQSANAVIITNAQGEIEYVNPKFTDMTGYTSTEVLGANPKLLSSGKMPKAFYASFWATLKNGDEWRGDFCNRRKNGELYWESAAVSPIKNVGGEITHFVAVKEDITDKKEKEAILIKTKEELEVQTWGLKKTNDLIKILYKELEKKNADLLQLDKMKSEFVSTVSHELRTPLTIIREGVKQVLDKILGPVTEDQHEFLSMALSNIDRLSKIINDLLDMSKIESGALKLEKTSFDIKELAMEIKAAFLTTAYEKKVKLKENLPAEGVIVAADRDKIYQVFTNLVANALRYTEKGSVSIGIRIDNENVVCSVTDTGIGISEENIHKLFDKFQQFGRVDGPGEKGTGLGLSIARAIVTMHGGDIWVKSKFHEGSTFYFSLPL